MIPYSAVQRSYNAGWSAYINRRPFHPAQGSTGPERAQWRAGWLDAKGRFARLLGQSRFGGSVVVGASEPLSTLHPVFRAQIELLLANLAARTDERGLPWQPRLYYAWRSLEEQKALVDRGDSKVLFSYHNVTDPLGNPQAMAGDIIDRRYAWDLADRESAWTTAQRNRFWRALGDEAEALGLTWGGRWTDPYDPAHVQAYPQSSGARTYLAQGHWPPPAVQAA